VCGQPFASKGYPQQADRKRSEMLAAVKRASRDGRDPIYCDTSPCTLQPVVQHCTEGVSTSRTCEIGLSSHSGVDYHSLVYLVDLVTRPAQAQG